MEVELVQTKEQLDQQQPNSPPVSDFLTPVKGEQHNMTILSLNRDFQQETASQRGQLNDLNEEVRELRKDRDNCRTKQSTATGGQSSIAAAMTATHPDSAAEFLQTHTGRGADIIA